MEMETAENRNKKSKIGFYVHYDWGFNLTHDIVSFLQQIANDFKHELIQYYKTRATELLEKAEKESDYVDDFPKHDRFLRMKDVAPEMYEMLDKLVEAIDSVDTVNGLFPFGIVKIRSELVKDAKTLLARIDGEEER